MNVVLSVGFPNAIQAEQDYTIYFAANIVQYVLNNVHIATPAKNACIETLIQPVL